VILKIAAAFGEDAHKSWRSSITFKDRISQGRVVLKIDCQSLAHGVNIPDKQKLIRISRLMSILFDYNFLIVIFQIYIIY
jgi:hypothetical protein